MQSRRRLSVFVSLIIFIAAISLVFASIHTDYWAESRPINAKFNSDNNYVNLGLFRVYEELHNRISFMAKVPWIFIIFFLALGILWNILGAIVALLNTVAKETDTVAGPKGIYLWSILSVVSYAAALATFLVQYATTIRCNVLLDEHISSGFSTENRTRSL
ncbi:unnamed protein product [Gongylonema pulchrum]|uniref:Uncharacterized protein n=1 Tax=Gongylonema pulchrum TaxID=637853 RepID=A0A183CWG6_9BILA|nr:unnamed protein product [Gongylonema pulchrum]